METLPKASLGQMLATIPPQGLDRKVSDIHLADIATALIDWKQVCTNLWESRRQTKWRLKKKIKQQMRGGFVVIVVVLLLLF